MSLVRRPLTAGIATLAAALVAVLTASPAAVATFPGDAGLLVFQQATDDGLQLFTMPANGGEPLQITHVEPRDGDDVGASQPDWSPDGTRIAFAYQGCQIGLIDADGGNLSVLPVEAGSGTPGVDLCEADSSFTPDGQSVVFERYVGDDSGGTADISVMALDGTGRTRITDAGSVDPNVSPDGTHVAFKSNPNGALAVARLDGSDVRLVSPDLSVGYKADWAPDGSVLVFSDYSEPGPGDVVNIATVAPDGTGLRYLTDVDAGSYAYVGGYSPDGASIVYRVDRGDEHALFVMAADGSDVRQVTEFSEFSPRFIDWGPAPSE